MKEIELNDKTADKLLKWLQDDRAESELEKLNDRQIVDLFDRLAAEGFYHSVFFQDGEVLAARLFKAFGKGGSVLDIGSGSGHFIRHADVGDSYKGEEIDAELVELSRLLIEKAGLMNAEIEQVDALLNFGQTQYDQVFCNMPFIGRIEPRYFKALNELSVYQIETRSLPDWLFAIRVIESLKDEGIGIAIMRLSSLNSLKDADIRKQLINKHCIQAVIRLADRLSKHTTSEMAMVIFNKAHQSEVTFVDASDIWSQTATRHYRQLSQSQIDEIVHAVQAESDISVRMPIHEIAARDYNLSPHIYLINNQSTGLKLGDIARIYRGRDITKKVLDTDSNREPYGCLLNLSELQDSYIAPVKQALSKELIAGREKWLLHENDIVLTARGSSLKLAMIDKRLAQKKLIPSSNIMVIRCHHINPYFVFAYLSSAAGRQHLRRMQTGSSLFVLSLKNMQQLTIPEEDEKVAERMRESLDDYQQLMQQVEKYHQVLPYIYK